jgi:hypothetical protein
MRGEGREPADALGVHPSMQAGRQWRLPSAQRSPRCAAAERLALETAGTGGRPRAPSHPSAPPQRRESPWAAVAAPRAVPAGKGARVPSHPWPSLVPSQQQRHPCPYPCPCLAFLTASYSTTVSRQSREERTARSPTQASADRGGAGRVPPMPMPMPMPIGPAGIPTPGAPIPMPIPGIPAPGLRATRGCVER